MEKGQPCLSCWLITSLAQWRNYKQLGQMSLWSIPDSVSLLCPLPVQVSDKAEQSKDGEDTSEPQLELN